MGPLRLVMNELLGRKSCLSFLFMLWLSSSISVTLSHSYYLQDCNEPKVQGLRVLLLMCPFVSLYNVILGPMRARASRVLVQQADPSNSGIPTSVVGSNDRKLPQPLATTGDGRSVNVRFGQKKDSVPPEDSLLTPPSSSGTITNVGENNMCPFEMQQREVEVLSDQEKGSLPVSSSHLLSSNDYKQKDQASSADNASLTFQSKYILFDFGEFANITTRSKDHKHVEPLLKANQKELF